MRSDRRASRGFLARTAVYLRNDSRERYDLGLIQLSSDARHLSYAALRVSERSCQRQNSRQHGGCTLKTSHDQLLPSLGSENGTGTGRPCSRASPVFGADSWKTGQAPDIHVPEPVPFSERIRGKRDRHRTSMFRSQSRFRSGTGTLHNLHTGNSSHRKILHALSLFDLRWRTPQDICANAIPNA
jgi:hypothetical protein